MLSFFLWQYFKNNVLTKEILVSVFGQGILSFHFNWPLKFFNVVKLRRTIKWLFRTIVLKEVITRRSFWQGYDQDELNVRR